MFSVDSEPERQSWIEAIEAVKEVSVERFSDSSVDAVLGAGSHFCWGVSGKK